ncbi:hypothetical protein Tsp_01143 [Trichinella spiralis]|uniref:hypothetical protein n=1 Tax=Trichinella spiralis TaxID=6334 RepID=UPI0001EFC463|nr:hypothetical protein Tsp_01143 [Trichinella spiralis]
MNPPTVVLLFMTSVICLALMQISVKYNLPVLDMTVKSDVIIFQYALKCSSCATQIDRKNSTESIICIAQKQLLMQLKLITLQNYNTSQINGHENMNSRVDDI